MVIYNQISRYTELAFNGQMIFLVKSLIIIATVMKLLASINQSTILNSIDYTTVCGCAMSECCKTTIFNS